LIDKLEMFLALARERHFGRAAEAVGVAQPTLSAAIRQLEASLGAVLVLRGSRFGGLTPEGERALVWARRMVADARSLREDVRAGGLGGTLRLAVIPTALAAASRLTAAFAGAHGGVRVTVVSTTNGAIREGLAALTFDAGITYVDDDPGAILLHEERYALILRDDHPLAGRPALPWREAGALPLCLLTPDMQNRRIIAGHLAEAGEAASPQVEANSIVVLIAHVLAGSWATILPMGAAELFLRHGTPAGGPPGRARRAPPRGPPCTRAALAGRRGARELGPRDRRLRSSDGRSILIDGPGRATRAGTRSAPCSTVPTV
jgi:DNA-binding transcriptional LysR family regulator